MDAAKYHRDMNDPAWRRWSLLSALVVLGFLYILTYAVFVARSQDFIVAKRNQRARDFSREHVINPPATLQFGLGSGNDTRLGGGWHDAEPGGVWSAQEDVWIELNLRRENSAHVVRLNMTAFVAKRHRRVKVAAELNGTAAGSWIRDMTNASDPLDIDLPRSLGRTGQLAIHLFIDHPASPFDTHDGPDKRRLGLLLYSIEVR
jgi:hypothetical protein